MSAVKWPSENPIYSCIQLTAEVSCQCWNRHAMWLCENWSWKKEKKNCPKIRLLGLNWFVYLSLCVACFILAQNTDFFNRLLCINTDANQGIGLDFRVMFLLIFYTGCFLRGRTIEVMWMDAKKRISSCQSGESRWQLGEEQGLLHWHYKQMKCILTIGLKIFYEVYVCSLQSSAHVLFPLCVCSNVLTCGENCLDRFALQGSIQSLESHCVLGRWAQLCQAVGSSLRV